MFFLNLGIAQFLAIAGALSALTVALYLFDRSRRRRVVPTLRFWAAAKQPTDRATRRHIQQPVSLLLQLLGILLLILAIAQPRFGNPFAKPADHVLILETSAWMAATKGDHTLMDEARDRASTWLRTVAPTDRVMLLRADALATPATAFEFDRRKVRDAIASSQPGATALDLAQAVTFARRSQALQSSTGEIVFVGSGRVSPNAAPVDTANLRALLVPNRIENAGLRAVAMHRDPTDPAHWIIAATVRNYGVKPCTLTVSADFDQAPSGARLLTLAPNQETEVAFNAHTRAAGLLDIRLTPPDAFPDDDRASLQVPGIEPARVAVYAAQPAALRPLFAANTHIEPVFLSPGQPTQLPAIWIDPAPTQSPIPIDHRVTRPEALAWTSDPTLGAGLRAHDARIANASILKASPADIRVATIPEGPVLLARPNLAVFGFDPAAATLRFELSTPILFANILRWMYPDAFRQTDYSVRTAGAIATTIDNTTNIRVTRADGTPIPFTLDAHTLHFFSGARDTIHVVAGDRESIYTLTLPELFESNWQPPASVPRNMPRRLAIPTPSSELWPWLAALGAACFLGEWFLFSRARSLRRRAA